jgi:hypothetical protein
VEREPETQRCIEASLNPRASARWQDEHLERTLISRQTPSGTGAHGINGFDILKIEICYDYTLKHPIELNRQDLYNICVL